MSVQKKLEYLEKKLLSSKSINFQDRYLFPNHPGCYIARIKKKLFMLAKQPI